MRSYQTEAARAVSHFLVLNSPLMSPVAIMARQLQHPTGVACSSSVHHFPFADGSL